MAGLKSLDMHLIPIVITVIKLENALCMIFDEKNFLFLKDYFAFS